MMTLGEKLGRIVIPMITPIKQNGDVNYDESEKLVNFLVENNYCDSILVAGTTGEFTMLEHKERIELFKVVKNAVNGRVPLVAGTGAGSAREAVKFTQEAEKLGYDCAMVVGPYYCKPTQEGVYRYFESIANSVEIPIMLYNIPIFTGLNVEPKTVQRLVKIKNIKGIKDESGINPVQMTDFTLVSPEDFTVYNGDDIMVLCGLVQGAAGVVSGFSHLAGDKMRKMINLFIEGKIEEARELHMAFHPLLRALAPNGRIHPGPVLRAALELAGHKVGKARLPLDEATPAEKEEIKKQMIRLGII